MDTAMIRALSEVHGSPAVSIVCPLDERRPGNDHDRIALARLRDEAAMCVSSSLTKLIDEALAGVDLEHPPAAVAIYVAPEYSKVVALDVPVEPSVSIGGRFAIRPLIRAAARDSRARAVVVTEHGARCVDVSGDLVQEHLDTRFPITVTPPTEADTPHRDFPLDEHERAEAVKFVLRAVDRAVSELQRHDERPLVLVGPERNLAYFDEITAQPARTIVARVHGNHQRSTADEIGALVRPALDAFTSATHERACRDIREAIGRHAVAGITDTWQAARSGRGHALVVEDGYAFRARAVDGVLDPAPDEPGAFDAVEDTIEEVVRHGGDVTVVGAGELDDLGHIAMLTRY
jgi:hypothetical protein